MIISCFHFVFSLLVYSLYTVLSCETTRFLDCRTREPEFSLLVVLLYDLYCESSTGW